MSAGWLVWVIARIQRLPRKSINKQTKTNKQGPTWWAFLVAMDFVWPCRIAPFSVLVWVFRKMLGWKRSECAVFWSVALFRRKFAPRAPFAAQRRRNRGWRRTARGCGAIGRRESLPDTGLCSTRHDSTVGFHNCNRDNWINKIDLIFQRRVMNWCPKTEVGYTVLDWLTEIEPKILNNYSR